MSRALNPAANASARTDAAAGRQTRPAAVQQARSATATQTQSPAVHIRVDKIVVDPALVPRAQSAAYRARLTARLRAMAADPALATASTHELEALIAHHAREAVKSDG